MVQAPSPNPQSSAPSFSLATLRAVLAELEAAHPERASRLVRAANIVAIRAIAATAHGNCWVQSECDPTTEYLVVYVPQFNVWTCTCQDFARRGGPCKHALAVQMLQACEERERGPEPPPVLLPFAERDPDATRFELTALGLAATTAPAVEVA